MTTSMSILVVEDEALIRDLLEISLTDGGFEVVLASDGAEAYRQIEQDLTRFRAVLTDIRLGSGPDGWQIAHRARELVPHIPIVYMSGDSAADWSSNGVPNSIMISKPFAPSQVLTAISTLLNEADSHQV